MAIPDRLNPRVWLRDWLNKPTRAEQAKASQHGEFSVLAARHTVKVENGEIVGTERISESGEGFGILAGRFRVAPGELSEAPESPATKPSNQLESEVVARLQCDDRLARAISGLRNPS